jgi:hypothetical protein
MINLELINSLKPCQDGVSRALEHYSPDLNLTLEEFLNLDKISFKDRVWVCSRLPQYSTNARLLMAADIVEESAKRCSDIYLKNSILNVSMTIRKYVYGEYTVDDLIKARNATIAAEVASANAADAAARADAADAADATYAAAYAARAAANAAADAYSTSCNLGVTEEFIKQVFIKYYKEKI